MVKSTDNPHNQRRLLGVNRGRKFQGRNDMIEVFQNTKGKALRTSQAVKQGERIAEMVGTVIALDDPRVDEYPLQISDTEYLMGYHDAPTEYLNHSCNHNCMMLFDNGQVFVAAVRDIQAGEELTFNYNTTEWDIGPHSFNCLCGTAECVGRIQGFKHLDDAQRERLRPYLAPYLLRKLNSSKTQQKFQNSVVK